MTVIEKMTNMKLFFNFENKKDTWKANITIHSENPRVSLRLFTLSLLLGSSRDVRKHGSTIPIFSRLSSTVYGLYESLSESEKTEAKQSSCPHLPLLRRADRQLASTTTTACAQQRLNYGETEIPYGTTLRYFWITLHKFMYM